MFVIRAMNSRLYLLLVKKIFEDKATLQNKITLQRITRAPVMNCDEKKQSLKFVQNELYHEHYGLHMLLFFAFSFNLYLTDLFQLFLCKFCVRANGTCYMHLTSLAFP